jgi:hypothetical protein
MVSRAERQHVVVHYSGSGNAAALALAGGVTIGTCLGDAGLSGVGGTAAAAAAAGVLGCAVVGGCGVEYLGGSGGAESSGDGAALLLDDDTYELAGAVPLAAAMASARVLSSRSRCTRRACSRIFITRFCAVARRSASSFLRCSTPGCTHVVASQHKRSHAHVRTRASATKISPIASIALSFFSRHADLLLKPHDHTRARVRVSRAARTALVRHFAAFA